MNKTDTINDAGGGDETVRTYRTVSTAPGKSEKSEGSIMHTFKTLRHFNELKQSVRRAEIDYHSQIFSPNELEKKPERKLQYSTAHKLRGLSGSVYDDMGEVKMFRKSLFEQRARQRANALATNQQALSLYSTSPSLSVVTSGYSDRDISSPSSPFRMTKIEPLTSAKAKLAKYSLSFDPLTPDNHNVIFGFHGQRLSRESFGILIRQGLHIVLSNVEVDSLYNTMDVSQDGTFNGKEFTRKFFNLGLVARRDGYINSAKGGASRRYVPVKTDNSDRENDGIQRWENERTSSTSFTASQDAESVMNILRESSLKWHHSGLIDPFRARGFESYLTPFQFKQQIQRSFEITLSNKEISALLSLYRDPLQEGMYCIDGHKFLGHFKGTLHQEAWAKHTEEHVKYAKHKTKVRTKFSSEYTLGNHLGR